MEAGEEAERLVRLRGKRGIEWKKNCICKECEREKIRGGRHIKGGSVYACVYWERK